MMSPAVSPIPFGLRQDPIPKSPDLGRPSAGLRVDQPIASIVTDRHVERSNEAACLELRLEELRHQHCRPEAGDRGVALELLVAQSDVLVPREVCALDSGRREPHGPPHVSRPYQGRAEEVLGPLQAHAFAEGGAADGGEVHGHEKVRLVPGPKAETGADTDVEPVAREVEHLVGGVEPDSEIGMGELEGTEPRYEPVRRDRVKRRDGEHGLALLREADENRPQPPERLRDGGGEPLARRR
jgi:hypothetical protein